MNEDLRKNLTNQIHDNNLLMQQNLKVMIEKSGALVASGDRLIDLNLLFFLYSLILTYILNSA